MHSDLHLHLATAGAPRPRFARAAAAVDPAPPGPVIALRLAHADERGHVERLAALDSSHVPDGDVLLALVDGEPVAGLGLADGHVVADPFRPTADAIALLRLRASSLTAPDAPRRGLRAALRARPAA